jgi:predicted nucleic acid-binding protein
VVALTCYLDTSVVIALLKPEALSDRADRFISENKTVILSDFAAAEFASAVARWVRSRELNMSEGHRA